MAFNCKRYYLVDGLYEKDDGLVYFDHDVEFSDDARERVLQYKGCGIFRATIIRVITSMYDVSAAKIKHWIHDYQTVWQFRDPGETLKRAKWFMSEKKRNMGKTSNEAGYKPDAEVWDCNNMPVCNQRHRFNKKNPLTKEETGLLVTIRSYSGDIKYKNHGFFDDLLTGR